MVQLDGTNLRLLELLQEDARTSIIDLARSVDRAESTVRERIAALERDGVVKGYRALLDAEKLGFRARAHVRAACDRRRIAEAAKRLAAIPHVTRVDLTSGPKPLQFELMAESLARLEQVLEERIAPLELEGVEVEVVLRPLLAARPLAVQAAPAAGPPTAPPKELGELEFPVPLAPLLGAKEPLAGHAPARPLVVPPAR